MPGRHTETRVGIDERYGIRAVDHILAGQTCHVYACAADHCPLDDDGFLATLCEIACNVPSANATANQKVLIILGCHFLCSSQTQHWGIHFNDEQRIVERSLGADECSRISISTGRILLFQNWVSPDVHPSRPSLAAKVAHFLDRADHLAHSFHHGVARKNRRPDAGDFRDGLAFACFLGMRNHSLVKPTTGQFTRIPVVLTGPPPGLTNKPVLLLAVRSSPSVISSR